MPTRTCRRTGISITLSGSELAALKDISAAAGSSGGSSASASHNAKLSSTAAPLLLLLQHPEILGKHPDFFTCAVDCVPSSG